MTASRASRAAQFLRRLPGSGRLALAIVVGLWVVAAFSPAASRAASDIRLENRLLAPSSAHLFGTDDLGRDLLARVVVATPISLGRTSFWTTSTSTCMTRPIPTPTTSM